MSAGDHKGHEDLIRAQRDLALALTAVSDLDEALDACLRTALEIAGMDGGGVYLFDDDTQGLDLVLSIGLSPEFIDSVKHYDAGAPNAALIRRGAPLYVRYEALDLPSDDARRREGLKVTCVLPISHDERVIGCLNVGSYTLEEIPLSTQHALESLAAHIGTSVVRIKAQEALRESEAQHRWLAENLTDVVWTSDLNLRVTYTSPSAERMRGYTPDEVVGQLLVDMISPESATRAWAALAERMQGAPEDYAKQVIMELDLLHKDGSTVPAEITAALTVDDKGMPTGVIGVTRDISERRRAERDKAAVEEQLRQAQKMEAIGTLAGGVAHDFNNLLTAILGCASVMKLRGQPGTEGFADLERIESAAKRAAELTRQLLGFARKGKLRNEPLDMHGVVDEVISILKHTIDKRIRIEARSGADRSVVLGDPGQLEQVVLNLAVNAADAMPEGGVLTFATRLAVIDREEAASSIGVAPGRYVVTEVDDDGAGIPDAVRGRIFEPFFTTKPPGKGTGMGLAVAYGIAKNHGGAITVDSAPGRGTTFAVYLPVAETTAAADAPRRDALEPGKGLVLVVDDERIVRDTIGEILHSLGYDVCTACDGEEGLASYRDKASVIDLVILDLAMPGLGGRECLRALRAIDPEVRVLVSTGHDVDGSGQEILAEGALGLLQKPYVAEQLGDAVAAVLRR